MRVFLAFLFVAILCFSVAESAQRACNTDLDCAGCPDTVVKDFLIFKGTNVCGLLNNKCYFNGTDVWGGPKMNAFSDCPPLPCDNGYYCTDGTSATVFICPVGSFCPPNGGVALTSATKCTHKLVPSFTDCRSSCASIGVDH